MNAMDAGGVYAQCFLIAKSMDSPAHVAALRQAFIDAGVVLDKDLAALEALHVPSSMHQREAEDGRRKVPCTLGAFHHMLKGIRRVVWERDPLSAEIDRVFSESHLVIPKDSGYLDRGLARWLPEVRSITSERA